MLRFFEKCPQGRRFPQLQVPRATLRLVCFLEETSYIACRCPSTNPFMDAGAFLLIAVKRKVPKTKSNEPNSRMDSPNDFNFNFDFGFPRSFPPFAVPKAVIEAHTKRSVLDRV